jgi:hypothetical protein
MWGDYRSANWRWLWLAAGSGATTQRRAGSSSLRAQCDGLDLCPPPALLLPCRCPPLLPPPTSDRKVGCQSFPTQAGTATAWPTLCAVMVRMAPHSHGRSLDPGEAGLHCRLSGSVNRPAGFLYYLGTCSHRRGINAPPVNFQAGMQQPGILQPAEPDSLSIGHRRFTLRGGWAAHILDGHGLYSRCGPYWPVLESQVRLLRCAGRND